MTIRSLVLLSAPLVVFSGACTGEEVDGETAPVLAFARSVDIAGDFSVTHVVPTFVAPTADGGCEIELDTTFEFTGELDGAFDALFWIDHDGPCDQPAYETFTAEGTWEGLGNGEPLTFDFTFEGDIDGSRPVDETAQGLLVVEVCTPPDVLGWLDMVGQAGVAGSYDGRLNVIGPEE